MTGGTRKPSWKEKEKNKRRERIRRAIAANIYAGLRKFGNYNLPKHCDNNQVLKALCEEAGWSVEPDGTTYRKGCKPSELMEVAIASTLSASPYSSSYQPSPFTSYNPSPVSSTLASPSSSPYNNITNANKYISDANSLIPWLKNLSSNPISSSSSKPPRPNRLFINTGSASAPVTPPTSSPRFNAKIDSSFNWCPSFVSSSPSSPTFSLVSPSSGAFGILNSGIASEGSSRMWTPSQSGICSPVMSHAGGSVLCVKSDGFEFGMLKAWEGETVHEECGDDLELTLGTSNTRADHSA